MAAVSEPNHEVDVAEVGVGALVLTMLATGYVAAPVVLVGQAAALWGWD
jgi:hypothetical protein